jgi:hypothetical protein
MAGKFQLELSHSQHMALLDLIAAALRCGCDARVDEFVNCSTAPATVTTPGELLRIVSDARYTPAPEEIPDTKARVV